ncbi:MAG: peptidase [Planctomycetaceae bacterium]|nr:MAG: peptidase [Planctomycetaceae bacterium]
MKISENSSAIYAQRRLALMERVREQELDLLLIVHPTNVRYLTGFRGDSTYLLLGPQTARLVSDSRYETQLKQECPDVPALIRTARTPLFEFLCSQLKKLRVRRLGFEAHHLSVAVWQQMQQTLRSVEWVPLEGWIETARQIKDSGEIAAIRRAVSLAERGFYAAWYDRLKEMSERSLAHELEHRMRRFGAIKAAFEPIVGVGPNSALPHYRSGDCRLQAANWLLMDWGAIEPEGYHSDLTRTFCLGKTRAKLLKIREVVFAAHQAAVSQLRPGVPCREVDQAARQLIQDAGYGRYFGHGLGHGIGLEIHEGPRLSPLSQDVLQPGMVITIEPGIYLPGVGGVRIEDDYLITAEGCERLSQLPLLEPEL